MQPSLTTDQIRSVMGRSNWKRDVLRETPTRDLLDRLEAWQYTRLDGIDHQGTRAFCELRIDEIRTELTRRRALLARAQANDSYAPAWPSKEQRSQQLKQRIEAVKDRWPLEQFCEQVLFCDVRPTAGGRSMSCCPFPDHRDDTPSFVMYPDGHAHCFGCQRGGDIIALAEIYIGANRFIDALEFIEGISSVGRVA